MFKEMNSRLNQWENKFMKKARDLEVCEKKIVIQKKNGIKEKKIF